MYIFSYLPSVQISSLRAAWQVVMDIKKALLAFLSTGTICYQSSQFSGLGGRVGRNEYYLQGCWQGPALANGLPESSCRSNLFVCLFLHTLATLKCFLCNYDGIAKICWFEFFSFIKEKDIFPCDDFF